MDATGTKVGSGDAIALAPFPAGFHPFWFWNGRLEPDGIRRQLRDLAAQGIKGVYLHSRQGLVQPYLSESFLDLVELTLEEASNLGLAVHLYDEYPYPSGAAGGAVVLSEPSLAARRLVHRRWDRLDGAVRLELPAGQILACVAFGYRDGQPDWEHPTDLRHQVGPVLSRESYFEGGISRYNDRRYFADRPVPVLEADLPEGLQRVVVAALVPVAHHKYWGTFPDVLDPAAVERFVTLTHERYAGRFGDRLGAFPSIFVDEVTPSVTATAVAALRRRAGDDTSRLVVALGEPEHPAHVTARRLVNEILLEGFERSFESPVSTWCRDHGLRYAGEKPSLRLSQLRWMDVPGCDPGHSKAGAPIGQLVTDLLRSTIRGNAKATASAAYLYGKEGALCECYHSLGWGATLQDAKFLADILLALGIRWLVPHAFFYATSGLRKHDAPPSFFHMPYWPLFGHLSRHVEEVSAQLAGSHVQASIAVVDPTWGLPDDAQRRCYEALERALIGAHLEWVTVDTDRLSAARLGDGTITLADLEIQAVVVPPMRSVEAALQERLDQLQARGVSVVRLPDEGAIDDAVASLATRCPPPLRFAARAGDASEVLAAVRRLPEGTLAWLVVNLGRQPVALELSGERLGGLTGRRLAGEPPPRLAAGPGGWSLALEPFETVLLAEQHPPAAPAGPPTSPLLAGPPASRLSAGPPASPLLAAPPASPLLAEEHTPAAPAGPPTSRLRVELDGLWEVEIDRPNLLRVGQWRLAVAASGTTPADEAVVTPAPLANQLRQGRLPFHPVLTEVFGETPALELAPMSLSYRATFGCRAEVLADQASLVLAMEPDTITGRWQLWVNDHGPFDAAAMTPIRAHVTPAVGLSLAGLLREGENELRVQVEAERLDHGLRDCLYVGGPVGVRAGSTTGDQPAAGLVEAARRAAIADLDGARLPYYAGGIIYRGQVSATPLGTGNGGAVEVELTVPAGCESSLEVAFGDGPWRAAPWNPRRVELAPDELHPDRPTPARVRLFTTLARAFEGRWFDPARHQYQAVAPMAGERPA